MRDAKISHWSLIIASQLYTALTFSDLQRMIHSVNWCLQDKEQYNDMYFPFAMKIIVTVRSDVCESSLASCTPPNPNIKQIDYHFDVVLVGFCCGGTGTHESCTPWPGILIFCRLHASLGSDIHASCTSDGSNITTGIYKRTLRNFNLANLLS